MRIRMRPNQVFFDRVGHDLRGELATILAGVHFLLRYEAALGATARQMLERVNAAGQRLRRLLDELGDASWAFGEHPELPLASALDLGAVLGGAVGRARGVAQDREVEIDLGPIPPELGGLSGDAELLESALAYALEFAVGRTRGGRVAVAARAVEGGAMVTVTDRAGSVPPERLAHLAEPFVEKDAVPRTELAQPARERLGLGLAICKGILQAHGGELAAEMSPQGDGIRLCCRLGQPVVAARVA